MSIITTESLTKSYGTVKALKGLDLQVHQNEVFGFIGPNGAGKSSNNFGILFGAMFVVAVVFIVALKLSLRRDVGEGIIPHKIGKADAPAYLRNVWTLSLRMHKGALISWTVVLFIFAVGIGSVDALVAEMLESVSILASWMSLFGAPEDAFLALMIFVMSLFVAAYGIIAALRVRAEEAEQHVDALLSTATTRNSLIGSHVVFSVGGTALLAFTIGLGVVLGKLCPKA